MVFANTREKLLICIKEDMDVKLDSINNQLGLDRDQLLDEFFLREKTMLMGIILGITLSYVAVVVYLHFQQR
jgi:hypothetical protein